MLLVNAHRLSFLSASGRTAAAASAESRLKAIDEVADDCEDEQKNDHDDCDDDVA